jgi:hypothetical protein
MRDEDIDYSDVPEVTADMFARALVRRGIKEVKRRKKARQSRQGRSTFPIAGSQHHCGADSQQSHTPPDWNLHGCISVMAFSCRGEVRKDQQSTPDHKQRQANQCGQSG